LRDLVDEGVIERYQRKGTFVAQRRSERNRIGLTWSDNLETFSRMDVGGSFVLEFQNAAYNSGLNLQVVGGVDSSQAPFLNGGAPVDAVLIFFNTDAALSQTYADRGIPVILVEPFLRGASSLHFSADHYMAPRVALEHLVDLGHKNIIHISAETPPCLPNDLRLAGYSSAMRNLGLGMYEAVFHLPLEDWEGEAHSRMIDFILERRATACYCASDQQSATVMQACQTAGIRIPDDLSIIAFEDSRMATNLFPPLSTVVAWSRRDIDCVIQAARKLIGTGPTRGQGYTFPVRLIHRKSTVAPRTGILTKRL